MSKTNGGIFGCVLWRAYFPDGIPELAERLGFSRVQEGEVGLIVGIDSGHEFDVRSRVVGQVAVPSPTEFMVAPGPLLFAWGDVMIRYMDEAGFVSVVVPAEEVSGRSDGHVRCRDWDIFVPVQSSAGAVVDAVVAVPTDWKLRHGALGMVGHVGDIGREEGLVVVVHAGGDIGPPEEGLHERCSVVQANEELDIRSAGIEADAVHALHAVHGFMLAQPDRFGAVLVLFKFDVHRHERGRSVVLRPVELDTARNPWSGQADERWFYDILSIEKIVAIRLVRADMDAAADLGQNHQRDVFIFEMHGVPGAVRRVLRDPVDKRQWIDFSTAPLVDALLQKHRIWIGRLRLVGRNNRLLAPKTHRALVLHSVIPNVVIYAMILNEMPFKVHCKSR